MTGSEYVLYEEPFGRPERRWNDNIRMDDRETMWRAVDWMHLVQDRDQWRAVVKPLMSLQVP
jgi:hypothetical protein